MKTERGAAHHGDIQHRSRSRRYGFRLIAAMVSFTVGVWENSHDHAQAIVQQLMALPEDAQQEVLDFVGTHSHSECQT